MTTPWTYLPHTAPFILPEDESIVSAFNKKYQGNDCELHTELPPEPYAGRRDAPVVLLMLHPGYHYDPLGRIEMLTNVRGSSAAELQAVFGVDLKELKPFVARYYNARQAWDAWRAAGSREEDVPDVELPQIPEDWLDYFWRHYGPSPQWVLYGGGENSWSALVRPHPGMAETERLRGELSAIKEEAQRLRDEADRLRQALADAREKNARLEATLEERTPPDKNEGNRVPSPPAANSMRPGRK